MKKLAIGCLVVIGLLLVVGGVVGYYLYSKATPYLTSFRQLSEIGEIEKRVENASAFRAPENGELTEAMVGRFVKVQEAMSAALGPRLAELKTRYDELGGRRQAEGGEPSAAEALTALKDLSTLLVAAKRAQVDALNASGFSVAEYQWVREQVYAAAGVALRELNLKDLAAAMKEGTDLTRAVTSGAEDVLARNKELVAPIAARVKDWVAFGFFGM